MNNLPKCTASGYDKEPFYLIQPHENNKKYVVSLNDKFRIRILLSGFIDKSITTVDLKITTFEDVFNPIVYKGTPTKDNLNALMTNFEDVVFHNGNHALMINSESGDSMTYDEHGLIYIATQEDYSEALENLGAQYRPAEKLIYQRFHWHHSTEELDIRLTKFIGALGLIKES